VKKIGPRNTLMPQNKNMAKRFRAKLFEFVFNRFATNSFAYKNLRW